MGEGKSIYLAKSCVLEGTGGRPTLPRGRTGMMMSIICMAWWPVSALDFSSSCIMLHSWARHLLSVAFSAQESVNEYQQIFRTTWQWVRDLWWVSVPFIGRSKTPSLSMLQTLQQLCAPVMTKTILVLRIGTSFLLPSQFASVRFINLGTGELK